MNGNSLNEGNWDMLRNDEADGPFSIEKSVQAYEENCKKATTYEDVAQKIIDIIFKVFFSSTNPEIFDSSSFI